MNFKLIRLVENGFKGCSVEYLEEEKKNDRTQMVLTKKYPKRPVHLNIERGFKGLRQHILAIYGYTDNMEQLIQETHVDVIRLDGESIILEGEKLRNDEKYIPLNTRKIQPEDGYEGYEDMIKIIESIQKEVISYLEGSEKVDDVEVALRWVRAGKVKGVTEEEITKLPPERLRQWAAEFLDSEFKDTKGIGHILNEVEDLEDEIIVEVEDSTPERFLEFDSDGKPLGPQPTGQESKPKKDKSKKKEEAEVSTNEIPEF